MIYHSILFSFCLMGIASAGIELCLKDNQLQAKCSPEDKEAKSSPCTMKAESPINKEGKECSLVVTDDKNKDAFKITCTIGDQPQMQKQVDKDKSKIAACSAGSVPKFAGVTLLLAVLTPLLSGVL